MLYGETTTRSTLDPAALTAKLRAHGVARLRGAAAVWGVLDERDLRQPHATAMEGVQPVKRLAGAGTVPGSRTLNALGLGPSKRGLRYHRLLSSTAADFISESEARRAAIGAVSAALAPLAADVTWILDSGFDDVAMWSAIWAQEASLVCRLQHDDRWVETRHGTPCHLADLTPQLRPLAQLETELVVQQTGQHRPKLQPVTVTVAATPLGVRWAPGRRTATEGAEQAKACWLVHVPLAHVAQDPWWLLTDRPVETAEQATEIGTVSAGPSRMPSRWPRPVWGGRTCTS